MTTAAQGRYIEYLRTPRWRLIRRIRHILDGGRCRVCFDNKRLEVHHRSYRHRGKSFIGELRDTVTLCHRCHRNHHNAAWGQNDR